MRSNPQTSRRSRTAGKKRDDLILWLKFENNHLDSSEFNQKTTTNQSLPMPVFSENAVEGVGSAVFEGNNSMLISGQGSDVINAELFDFGEKDFTIQFSTKFLSISEDERTIFDWGNLKLTNWKGVFSIHTPHRINSVIDYYDPDLVLEAGFNDISIIRKDGTLNLFVNGESVTEDYIPQHITGLLETNKVRSIGSNIDGTSPFEGLIDNFKVYNSAIHGSEPVNIDQVISVGGAFLEGEIAVTGVEVLEDSTTKLTYDVFTRNRPKDSSDTPMEYYVHWLKDGQNIFDAETGPIPEAVQGKYIKNIHKNELEIKDFSESDQGVYSAKVHFPGLMTIENDNISPVTMNMRSHTHTSAKPTIEWCQGWRYKTIQSGEDAGLYVQVDGGIAPFMYTWKKNGRKIHEGPDVDIKTKEEMPQGLMNCNSSIQYKNLTHNVTGITCEVMDALGRTAEVAGSGNILIVSQEIINPLVLGIFPEQSSGQLVLTTKRKEVVENFHAGFYEFIGPQAETVTFEINAYDINHILSNPGILLYDWFIDGSWKSGTSAQDFSLQSGVQKIIRCRIGFSNASNVYSYVNIYVNYSGKCSLPLALFEEERSDLVTKKDLTVQTGEDLDFSYLYCCCEETEGQKLTPDRFPLTDSIHIDSTLASNLTNVQYKYSPNYNNALDRISFSKQFWSDNNSVDGSQDIEIKFSNACGEKILIKKVFVEKGVPIRGQIGNTDQSIPVGFYGAANELHLSKGWIAPVSTKKKRIYYRVLINNTDMSGLRIVPDRAEALSGTNAVYKDGCVDLSFGIPSTGTQPLSIKIDGSSSCWNNEDVLTVEFYNNLPASGDYARADKFSKTYLIYVSSGQAQITSPHLNSSTWALTNSTSQTSSGQTVNLSWAYNYDTQTWHTYRDSNPSVKYDASFIRRSSARCWVAREIYGRDDIRWILFREWISKKENGLLCFWYDLFGKRIANFIKNKPRLKRIIKCWMDRKING
jgi:hypothetical protein